MRASSNDCGHHFHANDRGWKCCHCPTKVRAAKRLTLGKGRWNARPDSALTDCAAPTPADDVESLAGWLEPARRIEIAPPIVPARSQRALADFAMP